MADETLPESWFADAADMNTPADLLEQLAGYADLQPLIAANPAASPHLLTELSNSDNLAIRRAVAQNPNTPVPVLCFLATEFPREFLRNPIVPLLNMTEPQFIQKLPFASWSSLLKFADLPAAWFQQIKGDIAFRNNQAELWKLMQLHVSLADESSGDTRFSPGDARLAARKDQPQPGALSPQEETDLFLRFVLLFPYTSPMLKEQWVSAARVAPRKTGIALSLSKNVGPKTLARLAQENNIFILSQVARHPATSPRLLQWLAGYKIKTGYQKKYWFLEQNQRVVQCAVAGNPRTPQGAIYQLVSANEVVLRRQAVLHPSLEALDHAIMALDKEAEVRAALAPLPRLASDVYAQLATDPAPEVRAALARNTHVPLEILSVLARDSEPQVRAAAAGNPRLPVELQAELLGDSAETVRAALSGNARLSQEHAIRLARDPSTRVRKYLAANPHTPVALLDELWQTGNLEVWQGLARHPRIAPDLLAQLARRGDAPTRLAVAAHTRTPADTLRELAQEKGRALCYALASNQNTPLDVLEQMVEIDAVDLWYLLVQHPAMRHAKCRPLIKHLVERLQPLIARNCLPRWLRRAFAQYYTALPKEIVAQFAASLYWQDRCLVACCPHIPETVLETLAQDGICHVRAAARQALEQRQNHRRER